MTGESIVCNCLRQAGLAGKVRRDEGTIEIYADTSYSYRLGTVRLGNWLKKPGDFTLTKDSWQEPEKMELAGQILWRRLRPGPAWMQKLFNSKD